MNINIIVRISFFALILLFCTIIIFYRTSNTSKLSLGVIELVISVILTVLLPVLQNTLKMRLTYLFFLIFLGICSICYSIFRIYKYRKK